MNKKKLQIIIIVAAAPIVFFVTKLLMYSLEPIFCGTASFGLYKCALSFMKPFEDFANFSAIVVTLVILALLWKFLPRMEVKK
jgi:hypothetical protein